MKLTGRTILITGGTSGIGLELAKRLIERRNTVIVTGRDPQKLEAAKFSVAGVNAFQSDVSEPAGIEALFAEVVGRFPALDTLINNAGIMRNLDVSEDRGLEDVTREIEINLNGPVRMIQQFLPHLRTKKDALIVNVTSGLAFIPFATSPVYSATKAGLHAYTLCLRRQLAGSGVTVVELAPPAVETPLLRGEFEKEMNGQKAMDVATLVAKAIAGIEAGKVEIRPGLSNMLKIMSRLAPQAAFNLMAKETMGKR